MVKNGQHHLDSLRDGREIYIDGQRVADHVEHPAFRQAVRSAASLYDFQARPENIDTWSQLVIKHTADTVEVLTGAPPTGIWRMDGEGEVRFSRYDTHRRAVESEAEAFFLRISNQGDYRYEGADLGILVTRGRLMDPDFQLNERARAWIRVRSRNQRSARTACWRGVSFRLRAGVFRRRRSAASSRARNRTSPGWTSSVAR